VDNLWRSQPQNMVMQLEWLCSAAGAQLRLWYGEGARQRPKGRKWPFLWPSSAAKQVLKNGSAVLQAAHAFGMVRGELRNESLGRQHPLPALKGIQK